MSTSSNQVDGNALAGSVIAVAILDMLRAKGIFSNDECRTVLDKAREDVGRKSDPAKYSAMGIIDTMLREQYAAHR